MPWWIYLLLSLLDVIPNFMQLVSIRYTSLTSTTLLGSLTVPSTMFFSRYILARCFGKYHYLGVVLCVLGGALTVWSDYCHNNNNNNASKHDATATTSIHSSTGDVLAVVAALINGLGDVFAEYCVKNVDPFELLGMLGLFGSTITGLAFPWIERQALEDLIFHRSVAEQWDTCQVFCWYIASVLLYYIGEAYFLVASDATLLNLSLQASNLWAILFSFLVYQVLPPLMFYPALVLVVCGVVVYEWKSLEYPEKANSDRKDDDVSQRLLQAYDNVEKGYDSIYKTGLR